MTFDTYKTYRKWPKIERTYGMNGNELQKKWNGFARFFVNYFSMLYTTALRILLRAGEFREFVL